MLTVVTAMVLSGCATMARSSEDSTPTERRIVRLERAWWSAQQHNDTMAFQRMLAPDVTFIGTSGSLRDRATFIASRRGSWIPQADSLNLSELRVRVFGTTAIVTGRGTTVGTGVASSARFTDIWLHRGDNWKLGAVQRTDIAP